MTRYQRLLKRNDLRRLCKSNTFLKHNKITCPAHSTCPLSKLQQPTKSRVKSVPFLPPLLWKKKEAIFEGGIGSVILLKLLAFSLFMYSCHWRWERYVVPWFFHHSGWLRCIPSRDYLSPTDSTDPQTAINKWAFPDLSWKIEQTVFENYNSNQLTNYMSSSKVSRLNQWQLYYSG